MQFLVIRKADAETEAGVKPSAQLIDDVLGEPRLEALAASITDKPFYDGDHLNAARE